MFFFKNSLKEQSPFLPNLIICHKWSVFNIFRILVLHWIATARPLLLWYTSRHPNTKVEQEKRKYCYTSGKLQLPVPTVWCTCVLPQTGSTSPSRLPNPPHYFLRKYLESCWYHRNQAVSQQLWNAVNCGKSLLPSIWRKVESQC